MKTTTKKILFAIIIFLIVIVIAYIIYLRVSKTKVDQTNITFLTEDVASIYVHGNQKTYEINSDQYDSILKIFQDTYNNRGYNLDVCDGCITLTNHAAESDTSECTMEILFSKPQSLKLIADKTYDGIYGLFYDCDHFLYVSFDETVATSGEYGTEFGFFYVNSDAKFEQLDAAILDFLQ